MKTFMNITNYRSKSSNPLASGIIGNMSIPNSTAAASAVPVSTNGAFS